jgi:uncharacterized protein (DUF779 family)
MTPTPARVTATEAACALIDELRGRYGPVLFHQSGGCCDGSDPMCYPVGEFVVGGSDLLLGHVGRTGWPGQPEGAPFYIGAAQGALWAHTQLILDAAPGRGGVFSLDNGTGRRFLSRARLFDAAEIAALRAGGADAPGGSLAVVSGAAP